MCNQVTLNSFLTNSKKSQQFWALLKASFILGPVEDSCISSSKCRHQHSFIIPTPNKNNIFCSDDVKEFPSASTIRLSIGKLSAMPNEVDNYHNAVYWESIGVGKINTFQ